MKYDDLERPPLDAAALSVALGRGGSIWREIEVLEESPPTNAVVAERARAGEPEGLVFVADHQTAGRGRLDRDWSTPARAALTFSMLLRPGEVPPLRWPWLPLLTGIAVSESVRRVTGVPTDLKWPNDVLVGDQKVAGILVERVETQGQAAAVVGVGLNVTTRREDLPVPTATSLVMHEPRTLDRSVVLRDILRTFEALYVQWVDDAGDPDSGLRESYVRRCVTLGRPVRVDVPTGEQVTGLAEGVDAAGRLIVSTDSGLRVLGAGDVVHVRADDA